jgi:ABC-2 type transport system ATP-binding protein
LLKKLRRERKIDDAKIKSQADYEIWSDQLTKIYGKGENELEAVSKINLRIEPGIHGFLGPNGAGKTTTFNMLVGAISITEGKAMIRGEKAGSIAAKQLIGFLPQDPAFYNDMIGEAYLKYMGQLGGLKSKEAKRKAQELLDYFDLFEFRNQKIGKFSSGMRQKIGIAGALIHEPKILILDEPTANLDPIGRANVIEKIRELSQKMSVVISSHILSEIEQMCEKVTMINKGKIIISDSIRKIKKKFISNLYILDTNMNEKVLHLLEKEDYISNIWIDKVEGTICITPSDTAKLREKLPKLIVKNNAMLYSFHQPKLSLQDIFIKIMQSSEDLRK